MPTSGIYHRHLFNGHIKKLQWCHCLFVDMIIWASWSRDALTVSPSCAPSRAVVTLTATPHIFCIKKKNRRKTYCLPQGNSYDMDIYVQVYHWSFPRACIWEQATFSTVCLYSRICCILPSELYVRIPPDIYFCQRAHTWSEQAHRGTVMRINDLNSICLTSQGS